MSKRVTIDPVTRIEDIQTKILHKGQCLLDIFIENSLVFALLIRPDTVVWRITPFNSDVENALEVLNSESQHFAVYQNLPETETPVTQGPQSSEQNERKEETTNYEISEVNQTEMTDPGAIEDHRQLVLSARQ